MNQIRFSSIASTLCAALLLAGCLSEEPQGIAPARSAATTVKMDFFHRPLPEIPLPNDIATRFDPTSATKRRINASMVATTTLERKTREYIDRLDGWGTLQPITIPFTGPLDVNSILEGHRDDFYETTNDVVYVIDIDRDSPHFGELQLLDIGNGNYPVIVEDIDGYWKNDSRGNTISIAFEETAEDTDGDGKLGPGEDTDLDGVLDVPNYLPGAHPRADDLAGRSDALMTFYERETNTLILKLLVPLEERTTYAVVVTRRLRDANQEPVGSPYPWIHHLSQTRALEPLAEVLPTGLALDDVAFAFTFTTQTGKSAWQAVRDGLYGHGVQAHLGEAFPAEVGGLLELRTRGAFDKLVNPYVMWTENWLPAYLTILQQFSGLRSDSEEFQVIRTAHRYIDFHVVGYFESPQLFAREDANGPLPLTEQVWPEDLDRVPAPARSERVYFNLFVPRKEVSARGQGKPAPVIIMGHGYGGNRFSTMELAALLARFGVASITIDAPSHGIGLKPADRQIAEIMLGSFGLEPALVAILSDRAFDQNNDLVADSGADFWTAYLFHTRDILRQAVLDYMQLVRVMRAFDGERQWAFDVNGDGINELAGDFDADGVIDIGGDALITMSGGSLGGMLSMLVGALEPEVRAVAPIVGGGGLSEIGARSKQGGVREAFILRAMGPLYVGSPDPESGEMLVETIIPDLAYQPPALPIASVPDIVAGDILLVTNGANGEVKCGVVSDAGTVRVGLPADVGDPVLLQFFPAGSIDDAVECRLAADAAEKHRIDTFEYEVTFQEHTTVAGSPLVALAEGIGLRRANPELRRFQGLGQLVLDASDPAVYARHMQLDPLRYPGTGQQTGAHALLMTSIGDMSVPSSSGIAVARAAGLVDYLHPDERFGKSENQVLIDTYTTEGVNTLMRFTSPDGVGVHMDVDNFSAGTDIWGATVPRLDPPLRASFYERDPLGGRSAALFTYGDPTGRHGFPSPGESIDRARRACEQACTTSECDCDDIEVFDVGTFFLNMVGEYLASGGTVLRDDFCLSRSDCESIPPPPEPRYNPDDPDAEPPPPPPGCQFPAVQVGGDVDLDALVQAPARCNDQPYAWRTSADLGDVVAIGADDTLLALLLGELAGSAGVPLPRAPRYDARVVQVRYVTQDHGEAVEATTLVAVPNNYDGEEPLDMLLLLLPPQGAGAVCAASNTLEQKGLAALFASFGYVVVAPDYLGMTGFGARATVSHPYLVGEPAALAALDAVRAAGKLPDATRSNVCATPRFAVLGASEGAHAALFVERLAPYYAPELQFVGGAAAVPPADIASLVTGALAGDVTVASSSAATFFVGAGQWYGASDRFDEVFVPPADTDVPTRVFGTCDMNVLSNYAMLLDVYQPDFLVSVASWDEATLGDWGCFASENSLTTSSVPRVARNEAGFGMLFVQGEADEIVTQQSAASAYTSLCEGGLAAQWLECAGASHEDAILWALPEMVDFIEARFAGEAFAPSCQPTPAVTCQGTP